MQQSKRRDVAKHDLEKPRSSDHSLLFTKSEPMTASVNSVETAGSIDQGHDTPESGEKPLTRAGMAWTAAETSVLRDILNREGEVSESFNYIRRGEDAVKRKWRKVCSKLLNWVETDEPR